MTDANSVERIAAWSAECRLDFRHDRDCGHGAVFSRCGRYRYLLWRDAAPDARFYAMAMLNPSKADHLNNDPTIARCHGRARVAGAALLVWNLFALRETDPARLKQRRGPVGRHNDDAARLALSLADATVAAWGVHGTYRDRGAAVLSLCREGSFALHHLGLTKNGHPRHPLYLPKSTQMQRW